MPATPARCATPWLPLRGPEDGADTVSSDRIVQTEGLQGGQSQADRDDPRRAPGYALVDPRDEGALLAAARTLSQRVRLFGHDPQGTAATWQDFFPDGDPVALTALLQRTDGQVAPHLALWGAFLRLYRQPQALLNDFTAEHFDHQVRQVLGFAPAAPLPDHAHLIFALKKGAAPFEVGPDQVFSAGRDASGVDRLYRPVRRDGLNAARVTALCALRRQGGRLHFAPMANSADGMGAPLDKADPRWRPFGPAAAPEAPVGFAVASPLLRLAEGERTVQLALTLAGLPADLGSSAVAAVFDAWLSGPAGWLGPVPVTGQLAGAVLTLGVHLPATEAAVVDHAAAIHQQAYPDGQPVLQLLLRAGALAAPGRPAWAALEGVRVRRAQLSVDVVGLRGLLLENDHGALNPKKAFMPFGAQPAVGSHFRVGCPEALGKPLLHLSIEAEWHAAPPSLYDWYVRYGQQWRLSDGVSARMRFSDARGHVTEANLQLRPSRGAMATLDATPQAAAVEFSDRARVWALSHSGSASARDVAEEHMRRRPTLRGVSGGDEPAPAPGFVTVTLTEDFLHGDHRREAVAHLLKQAGQPPASQLPPLNEPYTPQWRDIRLSYRARSDLSPLDTPTEAAFSATDLRYFQVDAFGPARDHAWLRLGRDGAAAGAPSLLPPHPAAGELMIGVAGVGPGDPVSLLCQVAEGSADPAASPQTLAWSVLADNLWRPLRAAEFTLDTTASLRRSGLVRFILPADTSTEHTRMPAGQVWLRAAMPEHPGAACDLLAVQANAIEVAFVDQGNDPAHLAQPLAAGSIATLRTPLASVKTVSQPFASFGGQPLETPAAMQRRAAERLRHRGRAVTPWDVERLVLQAFPTLHRARCVAHARPGQWQAPGHRLLVLVPDLRNQHAADPLQPRVDLDTLVRVGDFVRERSAPGLQTHVVNPAYRVLQIEFSVRLRRGVVFSLYRRTLNQALVEALAPWAGGQAADIRFGGRIWRSALLDRVEEMDGVDWVSDFRLRVDGGPDTAEAVADTPDAILVPAAEHLITEWVDD